MSLHEEVQKLKSEVAWLTTQRKLDKTLESHDIAPVVEDRILTEAESKARKRQKTLDEDEIHNLINHEITYANTYSSESSPDQRTPEERAKVISDL